MKLKNIIYGARSYGGIVYQGFKIKHNNVSGEVSAFEVDGNRSQWFANINCCNIRKAIAWVEDQPKKAA